MVPSTSNACHRKFSSVMVSPDIDKSRVACEIMDPIWIGARNLRAGEVVTLNLVRLLGGKPLLAGIGVIADKLLLLCVH